MGECAAPDFSHRSKSEGEKKRLAQAVSRALHFEDARLDYSARGKYISSNQDITSRGIGKNEDNSPEGEKMLVETLRAG